LGGQFTLVLPLENGFMLKFLLKAKALVLGVSLVLVNGVSTAAEKDSQAPKAQGATKAQAAVKGQAPTTRTVRVKEWVPETYTKNITSYHTEYEDQEYTSYKCEYTPVTRVRTVTKYRSEKVMEERVIRKCHYETVCEEKTYYKPQLVCKPVTKTVCKNVDCGQYECVEVPTLCQAIKDHGPKGCDDGCRSTKMKKVWVPNIVTETEEVTCNKMCIEMVTCTKMVKVRKPYYTEHTVNVCVRRMVPYTCEQEYTCMEVNRVPVTCVRRVAKCIPTTETVECTRMVCREVEKEVEINDCCVAPCREKRFGGLFHRVCRPACE
jgi:hypothetical protein